MAPRDPLSVAVSALKRLVKEEKTYHDEFERQSARVQDVEKDSNDENAEYLLKQEVLYHTRSPRLLN